MVRRGCKSVTKIAGFMAKPCTHYIAQRVQFFKIELLMWQGGRALVAFSPGV